MDDKTRLEMLESDEGGEVFYSRPEREAQQIEQQRRHLQRCWFISGVRDQERIYCYLLRFIAYPDGHIMALVEIEANRRIVQVSLDDFHFTTKLS